MACSRWRRCFSKYAASPAARLRRWRDDILFRGEAIFAERAADQGLQDLLGPAPADAEHEFERGAIDERVRQVFKVLDYLFEPVVPERFIRQGTLQRC